MRYEKKSLEFFLKRNLENKLDGSTNSVFMQNILEQAVEQAEQIQHLQAQVRKAREALRPLRMLAVLVGNEKRRRGENQGADVAFEYADKAKQALEAMEVEG